MSNGGLPGWAARCWCGEEDPKTLMEGQERILSGINVNKAAGSCHDGTLMSVMPHSADCEFTRKLRCSTAGGRGVRSTVGCPADGEP